LWKIRFEPELLTPVLKCLLREVVKLAILTLIQVAQLSTLMMRPPENLTLPLPSSPFARHLFSPDLQIEGRTDRGRKSPDK
jgi:hypothetical protein